MSLSQDAMAEQDRSSAAATGVVGGLASEVNPHLVDEAMSLTNMYQELIDKEEELGGAKNLLSLSKKQGSSLKKTTKQPKPQSAPRGKGKIVNKKKNNGDSARRHLRKHDIDLQCK